MESFKGFKYSETGQLVYFQVNIKELFGVDLNTPGVPTACNYAFNVSKAAVPIKTGLMLRAYTIEKVSSTTVRCYFDPKKIIGKKRLGVIVKHYYPALLFKFPNRLNWLDLVIKRFYDTLKEEMKKIAKKNKDVDDEGFAAFWLAYMLLFKKKQKERQKQKELEDKRRKEIERKREEFRESVKKRRQQQ